jgi:hypothetical protein
MAQKTRGGGGRKGRGGTSIRKGDFVTSPTGVSGRVIRRETVKFGNMREKMLVIGRPSGEFSIFADTAIKLS